MYSTVSLAWVCILVFFVCLPLVCDGCVTFCFTENGKSERFLLEMTLLIFLGSCSLGL